MHVFADVQCTQAYVNRHNAHVKSIICCRCIVVACSVTASMLAREMQASSCAAAPVNDPQWDV